MKRLSQHSIEQELINLKGWSFKQDALNKEFIFKDFIQASGFMVMVALIAERLNHHPDWSGVYNKVLIQLSTHEAGGVTQNDITFAKMIEAYLGETN